MSVAFGTRHRQRAVALRAPLGPRLVQLSVAALSATCMSGTGWPMECPLWIWTCACMRNGRKHDLRDPGPTCERRLTNCTKTTDALGRYHSGGPVPSVPYLRGCDVLIPNLPQSAWILLVAYLKRDTTFCNHVVPYFHPCSSMSVYLHSYILGHTTLEPGIE